MEKNKLESVGAASVSKTAANDSDPDSNLPSEAPRSPAANDTSGSESSEPILLKRRRMALQEAKSARSQVAPLRWFNSKFIVELPSSDNPQSQKSKRLSPNGAIAVMIICGFAFAFLVMFLYSSKLSWLILVPLALYTLLWMLYPMVEPSDGPQQAALVMSRHPHMHQAQLEGCEVFFALSRNCDKKTKMDLVDQGAVDCALEAAFAFEDDREILPRAIAVVSHLAPLEEVGVQLIEDGIVGLVQLWLKNGILAESACRHGLVLLAKLFECPDAATGHAARINAVNDGELVPIVVAVMDAHISIARIQQWGCVVLINFLNDVPGAAHRLFLDGAINQVAKSLLNHPSEKPMHQVGIGILGVALTCNPSNSRSNFEDIMAGLMAKKSPVFEVVEKANKKFAGVEEIRTITASIMQACKPAFLSSRTC